MLKFLGYIAGESPPYQMSDIANVLSNLLTEYSIRLLKIRDVDSERPLAPSKWSRKQLLGRLIDSASNNHQRFVRAQIADELSFPAYQQKHWVQIQHYQDESWAELAALWKSYNLHLAHVIANIPDDQMNRHVKVGDGEPVTLRYLAEDYVRHLKHHLAQMLS